MAFIRKTASMAAALALALAAAPVPALASGEPQEHPLEIGADVSAPQSTVIKVEVPSSSAVVSIHIETSVIDGRFLGYRAGECRIKNLAESTVPIRAAVSEVVDGAGGKGKALEYLDVSLTGDVTAHLQEGAGRNDAIVSALAPGSEAVIGVDVADKTGGKAIPLGSYATSATVKVSAA